MPSAQRLGMRWFGLENLPIEIFRLAQLAGLLEMDGVIKQLGNGTHTQIISNKRTFCLGSQNRGGFRPPPLGSANRG